VWQPNLHARSTTIAAIAFVIDVVMIPVCLAVTASVTVIIASSDGSV
jgi:hypothetical protein